MVSRSRKSKPVVLVITYSSAFEGDGWVVRTSCADLSVGCEARLLDRALWINHVSSLEWVGC